MLRDAVPDFPGEIESAAVALEHVHDPQALFVVIEAARHQFVEHAFSGMAKRRVAEIVAKRDGLGELLVQAQNLGNSAGDLRHLEGVREPRPIVVTGGREEDLRLVLEPAKGLGVDDAIPIALERRANAVLGLGTLAAPAGSAVSGLRCKLRSFAGFELFADDHG